MAPTATEVDAQGVAVTYDLGEAQCPACGHPVQGWFINRRLCKTGRCASCGHAGTSEPTNQPHGDTP